MIEVLTKALDQEARKPLTARQLLMRYSNSDGRPKAEMNQINHALTEMVKRGMAVRSDHPPFTFMRPLREGDPGHMPPASPVSVEGAVAAHDPSRAGASPGTPLAADVVVTATSAVPQRSGVAGVPEDAETLPPAAETHLADLVSQIRGEPTAAERLRAEEARRIEEDAAARRAAAAAREQLEASAYLVHARTGASFTLQGYHGALMPDGTILLSDYVNGRCMPVPRAVINALAALVAVPAQKGADIEVTGDALA
jgi:hypothetical protein